MKTTGSDSVTAEQRGVLCPYCGHTQADGDRCESCRGLFEPLSRQASQNAMGPWFIRDEENPFRPGCSFQTIQRLAARGRLAPDTIIRGPSTRQFWAAARDVPGIANLLGECHNCHGPAAPDEYMCRSCSAVFVAPADRQQLGLAPVRLLPGEASPEIIAQTAASAAPRPALESTMNGPGVPSQAPRPLQPPPPPAPTPSTPPTSTTRRLRRQVANMRALATLLAIVVCVQLGAIVLMAALFGQSRNGETAPPDAPPATSPESPPESPGAATAPGHAEIEPGLTSPPEAAPGPAPADAPSGEEVRAIIDSALRMEEADTIDDLERAVRSLERLRSRFPEGERPDELDGHIRRMNERIRELSLSRFDLFGPGSAPPPSR